MKLVAEQVKYLRDRQRQLEKKKRELLGYMSNRERVKFEGFGNPIILDSMTDENYRSINRELKNIDEILARGEIITERNTDEIRVGTRFTLEWDDDEEENDLLLVEECYSSSENNFVSMQSDLGKSVIGLKEGDKTVFTSTASGMKLSVSIKEIKKISSEYEHFIKEKRHSLRVRQEAKKELHDLRYTDKKEYDKRNEITKSQRELLEIELAKESIQKTGNKKRIATIKKILERQTAELPEDDSVGIGSFVTIMLKDEFDHIETKSFELINSAQSTELESQYVERISTLGNAIYGLHPNDIFKVKRKRMPSLTGVIVSVDNQNELEKQRVYS